MSIRPRWRCSPWPSTGGPMRATAPRSTPGSSCLTAWRSGERDKADAGPSFDPWRHGGRCRRTARSRPCARAAAPAVDPETGLASVRGRVLSQAAAHHRAKRPRTRSAQASRPTVRSSHRLGTRRRSGARRPVRGRRDVRGRRTARPHAGTRGTVRGLDAGHRGHPRRSPASHVAGAVRRDGRRRASTASLPPDTAGQRRRPRDGSPTPNSKA